VDINAPRIDGHSSVTGFRVNVRLESKPVNRITPATLAISAQMSPDEQNCTFTCV
jgi:hypothetical protein